MKRSHMTGGLLIQSQYNDQSEKICTSTHYYQNPKNINACFRYMHVVNRYQYKLNLSNNYYHNIFYDIKRYTCIKHIINRIIVATEVA